jgi:hypothetical protein
MQHEYESIRRFLEHEESKPEGIAYRDPSLSKTHQKILKGLGRHFGIIDWSEKCTHWIQGGVITAVILGAIAFWINPILVIFIGGMATMAVMSRTWQAIRPYRPFSWLRR